MEYSYEQLEKVRNFVDTELSCICDNLKNKYSQSQLDLVKQIISISSIVSMWTIECLQVIEKSNKEIAKGEGEINP